MAELEQALPLAYSENKKKSAVKFSCPRLKRPGTVNSKGKPGWSEEGLSGHQPLLTTGKQHQKQALGPITGVLRTPDAKAS